MNIKAINNTCSIKHQTSFKGENNKENYQNPVSIKTERNLAILSSTGLSLAIGAAVDAIVHAVKGDKYLSKIPVLSGVSAALLALAFTLPSSLYHTKVNATVKEKEMDVFTRDKEIQKDLSEVVHKDVKNPDIATMDKLKEKIMLKAGEKGNTAIFTNMMQ